jgi:hypothetical protein
MPALPLSAAPTGCREFIPREEDRYLDRLSDFVEPDQIARHIKQVSFFRNTGLENL